MHVASFRHGGVFLLLSLCLLAASTTGVGANAADSAPILLVLNNAAPNPYGRYLAEILRAEGIKSFQTIDLATLDSATLRTIPLIILAETPLSDAQAAILSEYVTNGGRLVAMRPDSKLAPILGVKLLPATTDEGYLKIDPATDSGAGFTGTTLPLHGSALQLQADLAAQTLATLFSDRTRTTDYPAIVRSGRTVTWAYDLARSIVYSRQGHPENAGMERDGLTPIRTNDVFYNEIDKERVSLPVADIQMRFLSRIISDLLADQTPLPRLWYFPNANRTQMILTGDAHGNPDSYFQQEIASVESYGGQISIYVPANSQFPTTDEVRAWRARGHEFGMHPYAAANQQSYTAAYAQNTADLRAKFGPPSNTARTHQTEWQGWVDAAKVEAQYNIGLDTNFYTWGRAVRYPDKRQAHGYITGSALPMRFIDQTGAIIPVYQQVTSLIDEQLMATEESEQLSATEAFSVSRQLIDASEAGDYAAIMTQFHVDHYSGSVREWAERTMAYARQLNIPMWTAERWLKYTTARDATTITDLALSAASRQLSFTVTIPADAEAQSLQLPTQYGSTRLDQILVDGAAAPTIQRAITGRATTFVSLDAGTHRIVATYAVVEQPTVVPTPQATTVVATQIPTATIQPQPTADPTAMPRATRPADPPPTSPAATLGWALLAPLALGSLAVAIALRRRLLP